MSFGYGLGDVIATGKLAWTVYKSCKDAPASFGNISQEVIALEAVIRQFEEAFEGQVLSQVEQQRLESVGQGCQDVLKELQGLVQKYERLGSNAKLSFDRLKWGAAPVDELRTRLMSNTMLLSAFLQTSPSIIKKHIRRVLQEYRDEKREGSMFSSISADSLSANERTQWRIIRKELEGRGLTLAVIDKNRELIVNCLANALGSELIQDHSALSTAKSTEKDKRCLSVISIGNDFAANLFTDSIFEATAESQRPVAKKSAISNQEAQVTSSKTESEGFKQCDLALQAHTTDHLYDKAAMTKPRIVKLQKTSQTSESQSRLSFLSALRGQWFRPIPDFTGSRRSEIIDKQLALESVERSHILKVLLLGAGESGKTTLLKQIRLLHTIGFSTGEKEDYRSVIFWNILVACQITIEEMRDRDINFRSGAAQIIAKMEDISAVNNSKFYLDNKSPCYEAIKTLSRDEGFQFALTYGHEYALQDSTFYYFENLERLFLPVYIPTDQDVLRARRRTVRISETVLKPKNSRNTLYVLDVGGARSYRNLWPIILGGNHKMIFLAPIGGYNRCLVEDISGNAMEESLKIFESLFKLQHFQDTTIDLLFTKVDQLDHKLNVHPIRNWWPDYYGDPRSANDVIRYFTDKFLSLNRDGNRRISVTALNLTDSENVEAYVEDIFSIPR
ncbi:hypothetical protein MMC17_009241 [Xylographa soralifera]|nr:hypothetical protein [Xylographa soralifera]